MSELDLNPVSISFLTNDQTDVIMNYPNLLTPPMDTSDPIQMLFLPPDIMSIGNNSTYFHEQNMVTDTPNLKLIEEPSDKFRFRYKSEMSGTHGSLTGKNSDKLRKLTYPTVELCNFNGKATVRCSLYQYNQNDNNYEPHAHRLVKKYGNQEIDDPHDYTVCPETGFVVTFYSLGIIHTARKQLYDEIRKKKEKLKIEENSRLEGHIRELNRKELIDIKKFAEDESKRINLNIVCLRFDAFEERNGILYPLCPPIYSNPINNLKSALTGDLKIARMDHCSSPARGGQDIFIFVEKVTKKNIKIRFFELSEDGETEVWEDFGKFSDYDVHHQYAIAFKTPPYKDLDIEKEVPVYMELYRPSDGARSEPREFKFTPMAINGRRKRPRYNEFSTDDLPTTLEMCMKPKQVNNEELENALQYSDISSAEFQNVCDQLFKQSGTEGINEWYAEEIEQFLPGTLQTDSQRNKTISKYDNQLAKIQRQFQSFIQTKPSKDRIVKMLDSFCTGDYLFLKLNTFLHVLAAKPNDFFNNILDILHSNKLSDYANLQNVEGMTPLHVAVTNKNQKGVEKLLGLADITIQDLEGNTPLHIGVNNESPIEIMKQLVQFPCVETFINLENNEGYSSVHLAIRAKNLLLLKLLVKNGGNINQVHKNNGHTPLHMVVVEQDFEMLNFLLEQPDIVVDQSDFNDTNALQLAEEFMQEDNFESKQIYDLLEQHMTVINPSKVKSEEIDENDEESKDCFQSHQLTFTEQQLEQLAVILDKSGNWKKLAIALDFEHLIKDNLFMGDSPAKCLLEFLFAYDINVVDIRNHLNTINDKEAVELIDNMNK